MSESTYTIVGNTGFIKGGNAVFTVSNPNGERFTYRIVQGKPKHKGNTPPYFASVLKGPDNTRSYAYIGLYSTKTNTVNCIGKSKFKEHTQEYKVLVWAISVISGLAKLPAGYEINHAGTCCACNRLLTTPESIKAGIGPVCASKGGV